MKNFLQIGPSPILDGAGAAGGLLRGSPVLDVVLCHERQLTTTSSASGTWDAYEVGPVLSDIGPHLEGITVHGLGRNFSSNFQWRVVAQCSYDGETFTDFATAVLSTQSSQGGVIGSEYTTKTDFGRYIRFKVEVDQSTGTANEFGTLSVRIALRFYR